MRKLIRYFVHIPLSQRLPPIPRQLSSDYDLASVDVDTAMLMRLSQTRSPQGVRLLLRKHKAASARELAATLPFSKRPRRLRAKALNLARRALGLTAYDPMKRIARQHQRRGRR